MNSIPRSALTEVFAKIYEHAQKYFNGARSTKERLTLPYNDVGNEFVESDDSGKE